MIFLDRKQSVLTFSVVFAKGVSMWSLFLLLYIFLMFQDVHAFVLMQPCKKQHSTRLFASRRDVISAAIASAALFLPRRPTGATYSAYTNREEDWKNRVDSNKIHYSTARSLRKQLKEIAPMNSSSSKIFCPNGPSAAVSPLMENKCSDELAMPSIYGQIYDSVGNVVPGGFPSRRSS